MYITGTLVVFALSLQVLFDLSGLINLVTRDGKKDGSRETLGRQMGRDQEGKHENWSCSTQYAART